MANGQSRPARALWIEISKTLLTWLGLPSRPARALWIEIETHCRYWSRRTSRPARALWIEICSSDTQPCKPWWSRPARALWIEITSTNKTIYHLSVEAREGLVD